ncbi:MAG: tRNA (adenosine(37)-N6)-threonylcarbamoyltransferase complex dimerization subunit type 1 TsaB [Bacteroidia bacterium]
MNPYILVIETATDVGAVGLYKGAQLLGTIEYHKPKTHSSLLAQMIASLLQDMEVQMRELHAVAVSCGPGSYTGLRVGVSTAKGICMALNLPLLSVGSLESLAWQVKPIASTLNAWICPMIDARRMEVYCGFYDMEIQTMLSIKAEIINEQSFEEILAQRKVVFIGDGAKKCRSALTHENVYLFPEVTSSVRFLGGFLLHKYQNQLFEDLLTFEPFYLKDYVATEAKKLL